MNGHNKTKTRNSIYKNIVPNRTACQNDSIELTDTLCQSFQLLFSICIVIVLISFIYIYVNHLLCVVHLTFSFESLIQRFSKLECCCRIELINYEYCVAFVLIYLCIVQYVHLLVSTECLFLFIFLFFISWQWQSELVHTRRKTNK